MRRCEFLVLVGGAAMWPCATRAEPAKLPIVGFLGPLSQATMTSWTAAFVHRLHDLGWSEGRTIAIEYRWAEGHSERLGDLVAEFVRLKVAVIVTAGTTAVLTAKRVTSVTPIVFGAAGDPVRLGLVDSLGRPGGNVTGLSNQSADLPGKRLDLLREVVPGIRRVAILANVGSRIGVLERDEFVAAARTMNLDVVQLEIRRAEDIASAMDSLKSRADALYVVTDPLVNTNRVRINSLAAAARVPTIEAEKGYVEAGGLLSYGPNFADLFRRAAELVDKILRGANPGDIPVEEPTKFDLAVNLATARALGIMVPASLLARADNVIE